MLGNSQYPRRECLKSPVFQIELVTMICRKLPSKFSIIWTWQMTLQTVRIVTDWKVMGLRMSLSSLLGVRMLVSFEKNKNKLKGMNLCSIGINNPLFINDSICLYYRMLWQKCKILWSNKYIHAFWVSNGTLRLNLAASGRVHVITHSQDLDELFPENELPWYKQ